MAKKVCLFGLSANPPTGESGHLGIIRHLASLDEFDEVRVLPVYSHMFAKKRGTLANFEQRYEMCQLTFGGIAKVIVSLAEKNCFEKAASSLPENEISSVRVGTADLLDMLLLEEPNTMFTLALGRDTFMDLTNWKWRRSKDILNLVDGRILVINRLVPVERSPSTVAIDKNEEFEDENDINLKKLSERVKETNKTFRNTSAQKESNMIGPIKVIQIAALSDVSSTIVRDKADPTLLLKFLVPSVIDYIQKHNLYAFHEES